MFMFDSIDIRPVTERSIFKADHQVFHDSVSIGYVRPLAGNFDVASETYSVDYYVVADTFRGLDGSEDGEYMCLPTLGAAVQYLMSKHIKRLRSEMRDVASVGLSIPAKVAKAVPNSDPDTWDVGLG